MIRVGDMRRDLIRESDTNITHVWRSVLNWVYLIFYTIKPLVTLDIFLGFASNNFGYKIPFYS